MPPRPRPTVHEIALAAGVTPMAVSYALRDRGHVSAATRDKILRIAHQLGYRPDPVLVQLMHHVRSRRVRHTQATLGVLMLNDDHYTRRLLSGVEERAAHLAYAVDRIAIGDFAGNSAGLTRMLLARGIRGLLLPPGSAPVALASLLEWSQFSAVAMSYSITEPRLHRVVPHHFHNALLVLRRLRDLGCRRPAFVMDASVEVRANHAYHGAHASVAARVPIPAFIVQTGLRFDGFAAWLRRWRPDALVLVGVVADPPALSALVPPGTRRRLRIAVMDQRHPGFAGCPGIDQKTSLIGSTAVDLLVAQLHRQERGVPSDPIVSMVEGAWVSDDAARDARERAAR